jgi:UDP-glucuronate decarboxylase
MQLLDKDIVEICENIKDISDMFRGKRIVITGGQGFLGQYICATLNKLDPKEVIVIDNFITSGDKVAPNYNNFRYISASVEDSLLLEEKIDYIIFLAGIASPHYYIKYPLETINIVSVGLSNYLKLAKKHNAKLLFASSSEIYGNPDTNNIPTKETYNGNVSTLSERACYDESKRLGETLCRVYSQQGVLTSVVRPFNFFGPLMQPTDYRVLPNFANNILTGKTVELYGNGEQTRTFCYVSDGIAGIFRTLLLGKSGEAYNIGNPNPEISMSDLLDLCEKICKDENIQHPVIYKKVIEAPTNYPVNGDPTRRCPDITKAINELNYMPQVPIEKGLKLFLNWANNNYKKENIK